MSSGLSRLFLEGFEEIDIDVARCEFLPHCPQRSLERFQEVLRKIDPEVQLAAAERLFTGAEKTGGRLAAIAYIGSR